LLKGLLLIFKAYSAILMALYDVVPIDIDNVKEAHATPF
jgi:hypothetical protein